jgi:periplasmic protein TonB
MLLIEEPKPKRSSKALMASAILHVLVLALLLWKPLPRYVKTESALHGMGGTSHGTVYLKYGGAQKVAKASDVDEVDRAHLHLPKRRAQKVKPAPVPAMASALTPTSNGTAGTSTGTLAYGYADGHEIRPAYPVVYPDPVVARAVCPPGLKGDVIVEVTINEHGDIVATRLLSGLGHGVDERVVAVLQNWRYNPATRDGAPIASQQDVHFHFPS